MSLTPYVHLDQPLGGAPAGTILSLPDDTEHHLRRVLRLADGAAIEVADGCGGHAPATVTPQGLVLSAAAVEEPSPSPRLRLGQGLATGRKVDDVVRQATELGVDDLEVLATVRSTNRPRGSKAQRMLDRWEAIARAASEQARRPTRPRVQGPGPLATSLPSDELTLVAHPGGPGLDGVLAGTDLSGLAGVRVLIGPEGGFDDQELATLDAAGAQAVGLGPSVLRTEHAGAAALAVIAARLGRWDHRS